MRLVKACWPLIFNLACSEPPAPPTAATPDCGEYLRLPVAPRLVRVAPDGAVTEEGPLACPTCVRAARDILLTRTPAGVQAQIGPRRVALQPSAEPWFGPIRALRGVVAGRGLLIVNVGDGLDVYGADGTGPKRVPRPVLAAGESVTGVTRQPGTGEPLLIVRGADRSNTAVSLDGGRTPMRWVEAPNGAVIARLEGEPPNVLAFTGGVRVPFTAAGHTDASGLDETRVHLCTDEGPLVVDNSGRQRRFPKDETLLARGTGPVWTVSSHDRRITRWDADGTEHVAVAPARTADIAGAALPEGAAARRLEVSDGRNHALIIERVELAGCGYADRVHRVDLLTGAITTLRAAPGMRMNPIAAAGGFYFVEADVELSTP